MTMIKAVTFGLLFSLATLPVQAHEAMVNGIHIDHPWARPTPPVEPINSAVYLTIKNQRNDVVRLTSASSPVTDDVSIHRSEMVDGMMSMKALPEGVAIPAGESANFEPSGLHIMLRNLDQPLVEDERFPLSLSFDDGEVIEVEVYIQRGGEAPMEAHKH